MSDEHVKLRKVRVKRKEIMFTDKQHEMKGKTY